MSGPDHHQHDPTTWLASVWRQLDPKDRLWRQTAVYEWVRQARHRNIAVDDITIHDHHTGDHLGDVMVAGVRYKVAIVNTRKNFVDVIACPSPCTPDLT